MMYRGLRIQMKNSWIRCAFTCVFLFNSLGASADYRDHPNAAALIERVAAKGVDRDWLNAALGEATKQESILKAIARPAEKSKPWSEYQDIFLTERRTKEGIKFWHENRDALDRVSAETGVPSEIIVAIIGVETYYGRITGGYRVIDALSTLAFDYPRRSPFFTKELEVFLALAYESGLPLTDMKGSYAGAMGLGQFMPSSYTAYAKDFEGDGVIDIWTNPNDAVMSVANYFVAHGWRPGGDVIAAADFKGEASVFEVGLKPNKTIAELSRLGVTSRDSVTTSAKATPIKFEGKAGDEYWLGLHNFYVITRYNHSAMYAMAVYQLSQDLRARML
jgi:membrane-bound lytic murein transglycosylase B